jgi:dihydroneopterin aldolase
MLSIYLQKLKFHAFHGLYEEETTLGNEFEVTLTVKFIPQQLPCESIDQTINYVLLFDLVKERMNKPTPLLETIASGIAMQIFEEFRLAEEVIISITKLTAPIINFNGVVGVSLELKRSELL